MGYPRPPYPPVPRHEVTFCWGFIHYCGRVQAHEAAAVHRVPFDPRSRTVDLSGLRQLVDVVAGIEFGA